MEAGPPVSQGDQPTAALFPQHLFHGHKCCSEFSGIYQERWAFWFTRSQLRCPTTADVQASWLPQTAGHMPSLLKSCARHVLVISKPRLPANPLRPNLLGIAGCVSVVGAAVQGPAAASGSVLDRAFFFSEALPLDAG